MKNYFPRSLVFGFVLLLLFSPLAAGAQTVQQPPAQAPQASPWEDLGYGFGSVLANVVYMPFKITYAGLGLITGGLGYALSGGNSEAAAGIISPAVRGTYVITPRHLRGEESPYFVGPPPEPAGVPSAQR